MFCNDIYAVSGQPLFIIAPLINVMSHQQGFHINASIVY